MSRSGLILGVETSCDETSAAVLDAKGALLGQVILSQDVHEVFGGVVPELAARHHLQRLDEVVESTLGRAGVELGDIDIFSATAGPGLIGALLVGLGWTKASAWAMDRPLVAVHHMEGHLFAPLLENPDAEPPFVALLVSGGHTLLLWVPTWGDYRLMGQTRDDAAGEAFDKVAKMLGLSYPGGPAVARLALEGDADAIQLPRPMLSRSQRPGDDDYWDVSFSGLKTAVLTVRSRLEADGTLDRHRADLAASFQEAVVEVLAEKTMRAVAATGCTRVLVGGGVSANLRLRQALATRLEPDGTLFHASPRLSVDNAAMIARAGLFRFGRGEIASDDVTASPGFPFPGLSRWVDAADGSGRASEGSTST